MQPPHKRVTCQMAAKKLTADDIQVKIDAAVAGHFYYDVRDPTWKKTAVIGGAARRWKAKEDYVMSPGGRLFGPKADVEKKMVEYDIEDKKLYVDIESEGFKEELKEYKARNESSVPDDDDVEQLKKSIKSGGDKQSLKQLVKGLTNGRAVDVSDIAEGKFRVVNSPLATVQSRFVAVPSVPLLSKSKDAYKQALIELGYAQERQDIILTAFDALFRFRKADNVQTVKKTK